MAIHQKASQTKRIAIIGSGPAALMAADVVSSTGHNVVLFEKRKSTGRKLLIAGSSGLNISNSLPLDEFIRHYTGPKSLWDRVIRAFTPQDWLQFIEAQGISTFEGTSGRYFIEDMKASRFVQSWTKKLQSQGVEFRFDHELIDFESSTGAVTLSFNADRIETFDAACLCLGGASWEPQETPLRWPAIFRRKNYGFTEFAPSNVGFQVDWPEAFLKEAEGKPLKSIELKSSKASRKGEAMITRYGIEGTPVYFAGIQGRVTLDLKPGLTAEEIEAKLRKVKENLSPIRRIKKQLNLCEASFALVFHLAPKEIREDSSLKKISHYLKAFPLELKAPQPLTEAISSAGGLQLSEIDENFMLRKAPQIFVAGEMLDWDVPTGGFLIQGCVAQGFCAGQGILKLLKS